MRLPRAAIALLIAALMAMPLAGCGSSAPQLTATAGYAQAYANIESLRASATVVRARMKTTLEHAGTRVGNAEDAAGLLRFSLINLGTDADFVATGISQIERRPPEPATPSRSERPRPASGAITPLARPATLPAVVTLPPAATLPPADEGQPRLEGIQMASGVDDDDCAIDLDPVFTPRSDAIYVVAQAYNIAASARISSRWYRAGTEVAYFSFLAENAIDGSCIWFFIDQTDTAFFPGAWSVEILVDDARVGGPVAFQVAEA